MKKLFILLILITNIGTFANEFLSNQDCINVYREGYVDLKEMVTDFNSEYLNGAEFAVLVAGNSTAVGTHRAACLVFESKANEKCVESYKGVYKDLRTKIKLMAIISGNQTQVSYTDKMQEIIENEKVQQTKQPTILGKIGSFFRRSKAVVAEEVKKVSHITLLEYIDNKCI